MENISISLSTICILTSIVIAFISGIIIGGSNKVTLKHAVKHGEERYTSGVWASIHLGIAALAKYQKNYLEERTFTVLSLVNVDGHHYIVVEDRNSADSKVVFLLRGLNILLTDKHSGQIENFEISNKYIFKLSPLDAYQQTIADKRRDGVLYEYTLFARKV